jgi:hypothetical protein
MKLPINVGLIKLAQHWGYWDGNTAEFNDVGLEHFAAAIRAQEREQCISILERLHERSGEQHNHYQYAAKVLRGEA